MTKYNPVHRNELGHFTLDDWTSIYDIGETYLGSTLSFENYLLYEEMYPPYTMYNTPKTLKISFFFIFGLGGR